MVSASEGEVERRYRAVRAAAAAEGVDAVLVCGSEYTGFEGAVRYLSGFRIVHRHAYVLLPLHEPPTLVIPREARWVGLATESSIEERVFPPHPGEWLRERCRSREVRRLGVYGLDHVMPVHDYRALVAGGPEVVPFDAAFDLARAVKSEEELRSVRESMTVNEEGFFAILGAYTPGRTEAELLAPAEELFVRRGCGRSTMDMIIAGSPEFRLADARRTIEPDDLLLYSLEVAGPGGHWVEFSRPIASGRPSRETATLLEAYRESIDAAQRTMRAGATAHDLHRAVSRPFSERAYDLGHVTGHSIGMTMIELPRIGDGVDVPLRENMVLALHPHVVSADERRCFFMQDTWLVGAEGGEPLSRVPVEIFGC